MLVDSIREEVVELLLREGATCQCPADSRTDDAHMEAGNYLGDEGT